MSDYFIAYRARMERNNEMFLTMADELKQKGFNVFIPKDRLIDYIYIAGNEKHIYFGFSDVPYRFYLSHDIDMSLKRGSGKTLETVYSTDNFWSADYIVSKMQPNVKTFMTPDSYMKKL